MDEHRELARFLRQLANALERMSSDEARELVERLRKELPGTPRADGYRKKGDAAEKRHATKIEAESILHELATKESREEALTWLQQLNPSRSVLAQAAKLRDVHVQKQDRNSVIMVKLTENLVGSRLDSRAIRDGAR